MKRIPYGISNFRKIIEENYYYVDKTAFIETIENYNEPYLVFLRPRRFGKSLFISKLEYYYDKKSKDLTIFDNFYIGKNPTKLKNSYYILRFSFSGINTDTEDNTKNGFRSNIIAGIKHFNTKYGLNGSYDNTKTAAEIMTDFFSDINGNLDGKIYLLIDEYDHFANEILGFNYNFFKDSVSKNGFVRKFYETIKDATALNIVDRIFITGVSPITMDSMTSGFNISLNLTRERALNEMMGFTKEEVLTLCDETLAENLDIRTNIERLANYYNGYLFHSRGKQRIFNSDMILYYMSYFQREGIEPEDLIDRNVVSDYSKIGRLFEIGGFDEKKLNILKGIIRGEEQNVAITDKFNLENTFDMDDFKSLLFYMGFMTIKRVDDISNNLYIDIPNYVIKELYFKYFEILIERETQYQIDNSDVRNAVAEIAINGTISKLIKLTEETLHRLSNRDFLKFDEKYIQIIIMTYLFKSNLYYAKSEYEVEDGYIDIVLKKGTAGNPRFFALIELKYITKQENIEGVIAKKLEEAKEQLRKYTSSIELKEIPNLRKWAVVFCSDECVALEEI